MSLITGHEGSSLAGFPGNQPRTATSKVSETSIHQEAIVTHSVKLDLSTQASYQFYSHHPLHPNSKLWWLSANRIGAKAGRRFNTWQSEPREHKTLLLKNIHREERGGADAAQAGLSRLPLASRIRGTPSVPLCAKDRWLASAPSEKPIVEQEGSGCPAPPVTYK